MINQFDAEKYIVGFLLTSNSRGIQYVLSSGINEEHFTDTELRLLFEGCISVHIQRKEINALNVQTFLKEQYEQHFIIKGKTKQQTLESLTQLAQDVVSEFTFLKMQMDILSVCKFLQGETYRRKMLDTIHRLHQKLMDGNEVNEANDTALTEFLSLSKSFNNIRAKSFFSIGDAINEAQQEIEEELSGKVVSLPTGFSEIDRMIHSLHNGRLYVISAEEKVGKSLLSNQIALTIAMRDIPVGIISMEMRASEIVKRYAGIKELAKAQERLTALKKFEQEAKGLPLHFRQGYINSKAMFTIAQTLVHEKRCRLLIVDYLQLVQLDGKDRVNEINDFVAGLKSIAIESNIPIILISAVLNKQIQNRSTKNPTPADLRDSGRIANDCDVLLFLWKPKEEIEPNYLELFVSRGRNGEQGKCGLFLNPATLRLEETTLREEVPLKEYKPNQSIYSKKW